MTVCGALGAVSEDPVHYLRRGCSMLAASTPLSFAEKFPRLKHKGKPYK